MMRQLLTKIFSARVACKVLKHNMKDDPNNSTDDGIGKWRPARFCTYCRETE